MNTFSIDPSILAQAESYMDQPDEDLDEEQKPTANKAFKTVTKAVTKAKATVKVAKEKTKRVTKASQAQDIYTKFGGDKDQVIGAFISELKMSKAGATTYFYNAKKAAR